jgi:multidrug efflux pump subunit AcrA (membrane-fusion protein)
MGVPVKASRLTLAFILAAACRGGQPHPAAEAPAEKTEAAGTPVRVVLLGRATLSQVVTGPGRTVAFLQQKVRAPFSGTLTELRVVDGNTVSAGEIVGVIVSRDSEAAVSGAQEMLRQAKTEQEIADARRAVELAEKSLVKAPLKIPSAGVVLSHAAGAGDRLSEDQEILTVSTTDSIVFQADIAQTDLPLVHSGQAVVIALSGRTGTLTGVVHDILANANAGDLTIPVRIDLRPAPQSLGIGLFGTARIVVGERRNVPVVPPTAVIRDDVSGTARIATVSGEGKAHWVDVATGLADSEHVEIQKPAFADGTKVIVAGHVGLPEDSPVSVEP